jgi:hypothetical protein
MGTSGFLEVCQSVVGSGVAASATMSTMHYVYAGLCDLSSVIFGKSHFFICHCEEQGDEAIQGPSRVVSGGRLWIASLRSQ